MIYEDWRKMHEGYVGRISDRQAAFMWEWVKDKDEKALENVYYQLSNEQHTAYKRLDIHLGVIRARYEEKTKPTVTLEERGWCEKCCSTGFQQVVLGGSGPGDVKPMRRHRPAFHPYLVVSLIPCSCGLGLAMNESTHLYGPTTLRKLWDRCAFPQGYKAEMFIWRCKELGGIECPKVDQAKMADTIATLKRIAANSPGDRINFDAAGGFDTGDIFNA